MIRKIKTTGNKTILIFTLMFLSVIAFGQTEKLKIGNNSFIIKSESVDNKWNTQDKAKHLFIKKNDGQKLVLTYFAYKDEGGDCNNLFWYKEWLKVKGNTIIVTTHHFQKTGLDPITEWEKRTFAVRENGELQLTEHLFKKIGSNEWKTEEEWYKK